MRFSHKPFDALSLRELHDLLWLRNEVFVVHQQITAEAEVDGEDPKAVHIIGRVDAEQPGEDALAGCPIQATARLFFAPKGVKVGRVAVHPALHRQGVGTALMRYVHTVIGDRPAALSAQAHLQPWYEGLGWRAQGDVYDEAGIPHIYMTRPAGVLASAPAPAPAPTAPRGKGAGGLVGLLLCAFGVLASSPVFWACSGADAGVGQGSDVRQPGADGADGSDGGDTAPPVSAWGSMTVATFNTGTTAGIVPTSGDNGGYTKALAAYADQYYGDGLAWSPAVAATKAWFATQAQAGAPIDLVGFQEIFWSGRCPDVPAEAKKGFVCETWQAGQATVASLVLGAGYQVVCHPGKPDKCIGVRKAFGTVRGCAGDFCLTGGVGHTVKGCGSGSRVARFTIDRADGAVLNVVHVHGNSGFKPDDQACRVKHFEGIFTAMNDGEPGANGHVNLILGDFNTDPGRFASSDVSAARLLKSVGVTAALAAKEGKALHFITPVGADAPPTYAGIASIDHVISDKLDGACWVAGGAPDKSGEAGKAGKAGKPAVMDIKLFDHKPVVCTLKPR